jgi:hypothetical protein
MIALSARLPSALLFLVSALGLAPSAHAQRAVAIVVDLAGKTKPPLAADTEIPDKTIVSVEAGSTLGFIHYYSCRLVTVTGGEVSIDEVHYDTSKAIGVKEEKVTCPAEQHAPPVTSNQTLGTAALVLRSGGTPRTLIPVRPFILAVGPRARNFRLIEVLDGEAVVATLPLLSGHGDWDKIEKPLVAYRQYTIRFSRDGGDSISFPVTATPSLVVNARMPAVFRLD